jgi:signal transduction histidine kinase
MKKIILKLTLIILIPLFANAQQTKLDSIINLLRTSNKSNGVDTAKYLLALSNWGNFVLTDDAIKQLSAEAERFKRGKNEDTAFYISLTIFNGNFPDANKKIDYALSLIERIEKSTTPNKALLRNTILNNLRVPYRNSNRISEGFANYNKWLLQFKQNNDSAGIAVCNYVLGGFYRLISLNEKAIYHFKKAIAYLDSSKIIVPQLFNLSQYGGRDRWVNNIGVLGETYIYIDDLASAIKYTRLSFQMRMKDFEKYKGVGVAGPNYSAKNLAYAFYLSNQLDSAKYFLNIAYETAKKLGDISSFAIIFQNWALLELKDKNYGKADSLLVKAWEIVKARNLPIVSTFGTNDPDYFRALIQIEQNNFTKAADFLNSDIETVKNSRNELMRDYKLLADVYDRIGNAQLSKESYKKYIQLQDSLIADQRQFASVSFEVEQQMNEKELSINQLKNDNKIASITRNFIIGFAAMLLILAVSIYYRFQSKKKANAVLESTLSELKSTQSQLIQSEKMASLGELTAGIAHEIQNPLNFVNNFADVNVELIEELETEANKGNLEEVKLLAKDIKENETKITHHGKRADAIVKNMLQHSRKTSGQKELTDINALCDEYLRLSYHGLKAKDKAFNADFETKFDTTLAPINVVPQDIGRVILNLINNAFYAVNERQKKEEDSGYKPLVTLTTSKQGDQVVIEVADNGTGMPEQVKEKIFQPFFTTKPTGEGTGLGLSLSYDFVTKGHGGIMEVLTREGEGSKIIVRLPF